MKIGRKPKLHPHWMGEAIRHSDREWETVRDIARTFNVSHSMISHMKA